MHDVTHYGWLKSGAILDATTVPGHRRPDGSPVFWAAETDLDEALAAPTADESTAIEVYANHGRWIVECPDCCGAQLAVRTDPRFMCVNCGNASVDGKWRPVVWHKEHHAIEELLDARPEGHTRNWTPGEKVSALRAENKQRGVV